jgi:hypothetical protein
MANIKDFIKKIGNSAVSLEEQQQALAQVEQTIIEAKQKRTEAVGKNADMVIQALKTIEAKLEAKLAELNNTPAKQGVQGPTGKAGKDGKNGQDGRDGVSGKDGTDGKDGVDGQDGVSVVDAKIDFDGSLVVYLSNGNEIDCGQILSPDVAQNIIINSGGSGTSQTVTDTLVSLQNQINTLTGIDGVLGDMAQQNANAVAITGGSITGITDLAIADGGTGSSTASGARTNLELGTIATQNATAVAITGGTINGTTIGATTPSSIVGTTITGQTGVLRGTGQNFLTFSKTFQNAAWVKQTNVTATDNAVTAPDGTTTAASIAWGSATNATGIYQFKTGLSFTGISNTKSIYVRADVAGGTVVLVDAGFAGSTTTLTLSTSWQRVTLTESVQTTVIGLWIQKTASSPATIYLWGGQIELGSTANTYIPTTTTAVYGTPTLSFSGVSEIGLLSTGALYLQPAGTGALQAQSTTSTTAGGNARGANAVDWQTGRNNAVQVASGQYSAIGGGFGSLASGVVSGVFAGNQCQATNFNSVVLGGTVNIASGVNSGVVTGNGNTSSGTYGFVGGGYINSTTSNSAVTTQSGTMNATTAVTLSGSNANIKVGQLITGTSIANETYVAAISGTALTLSKVASGSSTSTLSFFTPHGVVVGGGNNQATGAYSAILGGGDAGTAANRNSVAGDWSAVVGGSTNSIASASTYSFIGGGLGNVVSTAPYASVLGGNINTASQFAAIVGGGVANTANSSYSSILGGYQGTTRSIVGYQASPACSAPIAFAQGVSQAALLILGTQTTDATATALRSNQSAAGTTNQVILPNNSAYFFRGEVVSGVTGGGDTKGWTIEGVIKRGAGVGTTALVGTPTVTSLYADAGASTWAIAVTADTTNGGLRVTFTGQAATTIRTVAQIRTTEMTY